MELITHATEVLRPSSTILSQNYNLKYTLIFKVILTFSSASPNKWNISWDSLDRM